MFSLKALEKAAADTTVGVLDNTNNGKCSNCGSCCSNMLPISNKEAIAIANYIKKNNIKEQKQLLPTAKSYTDMSCPFRSIIEHKCTIYPVRPAVCHDFQCDKTQKRIEADKRMYSKKYEICLMRETFFPKEE